MLFSAIGSIGDRLDSKFITAYFFPAFIGVLGGVAILVAALGGQRFAERVEALDSVEQTIGVALLLLVTLMLEHLLRALAHPIASIFAGRIFPGPIRGWAKSRHRKQHLRTRLMTQLADHGNRLYPRDPVDTQPTAFGNVLTAVTDYPRLIYSMEAYHWWPRLLPLLPAEFQALLRSLETPMRGMLNLSVVFLILSILAAIGLGVVATQWLVAAVASVTGLILCSLCYQAAATQATELARHIWVAFDLYRYEILTLMKEEQPASLEAERALWLRLAERLRELEMPSAVESSKDVGLNAA